MRARTLLLRLLGVTGLRVLGMWLLPAGELAVEVAPPRRKPRLRTAGESVEMEGRATTPMRNPLLVLPFLLLLGCAGAGQREQFRRSLVCGLPHDDVQELAERAGAERFSCYRPGGGPLICSTGWGRVGVRCEFDDAENLRSYRLTRLKPLTRVELSEVRELCARPNDSPPELLAGKLGSRVGTVQVADNLTVLEVSGIVTDRAAKPLPGVEVYFVDTGLDQWRSQKRSPILLARTDEKGRLLRRFEYLWGYEIPSPRATETARRFEIVLRRPDFQEMVVPFDLALLSGPSRAHYRVPIEAMLSSEARN